ncbi:hypothetical protein F2P79_004165 [Pimephales promelas]|nr:hypothetical protein F2P79_004165 [Pimephales promelas]
MTGSEIISHALSYLTRTPRPLTSDHINMSAGGIPRVAFGFKNFLQQDGKRTALCKTCNVKIADSQMTTSNFVRHLKSQPFCPTTVRIDCTFFLGVLRQIFFSQEAGDIEIAAVKTIIRCLKQLAGWQREKPGWCKSAGRQQAPGR